MREKSDDASRTRDEYRQREFLKSACEMREVVDQNENRTRCARSREERQRSIHARKMKPKKNEKKHDSSSRTAWRLFLFLCGGVVCARSVSQSPKAGALVKGEKKVTTGDHS